MKHSEWQHPEHSPYRTNDLDECRALVPEGCKREGQACPKSSLENSDQTCPLTRSLYPTALPERGPHQGHAEPQEDQNHSLPEARSRRTEDRHRQWRNFRFLLRPWRGAVLRLGLSVKFSHCRENLQFLPPLRVRGLAVDSVWGLEAETLPADDSEAKTRSAGRCWVHRVLSPADPEAQFELRGGAASGGRDPCPEVMGRRNGA